MVFGRKNKKDAEANAIMDAVLAASGEENLTADPEAHELKPAKKKNSSSREKKGKQVTDNPLILYGEKIALTLAILLSGYLIYSGFDAGKDQTGQKFNKTAEDLNKLIKKADDTIHLKGPERWNDEKATFTKDTEKSYEAVSYTHLTLPTKA